MICIDFNEKFCEDYDCYCELYCEGLQDCCVGLTLMPWMAHMDALDGLFEYPRWPTWMPLMAHLDALDGPPGCP
jgi:hypothetical protein